jgi:murein DD-endopeptidase MepM/ murein hydrolase activator NlpD
VRRLAPAALLAVVLALAAGSAHADTFAVVSSETPAVTLPSFTTPNDPSSLSLPFALTTPPSAPEQLSYDQLLGIWQRAGAAYGIQWQVLAAINKVESDFGRNMGPSSAGAIGWMQFMPSTWLRWGTDANGDGVADPWNAEDAIFSAARYLAASGGQTDISRAIFSYNHAQWYVNEVLRDAQLFGDVGPQATFRLDRMQVDLRAAERKVAGANRKLIAAVGVQRGLATRQGSLLARADGTELLSDRLTLEQRAALVGERADAAGREVDAARKALASARKALEAARAQAHPTSFSPTAGGLLGAPTYQGGYVFPVGGGPSLVSAGHTHHDYPAVDIAAPTGSPEYALANAVVVDAWSTPNGRCGIGMTIRTTDGLTWTYCHMSYLEPAVQTGAALVAGQPVGLVGMTGHATGPHLHLQLQPPTQWPQQMPWFQSFAGVAFRWNDAPAVEPGDGPTFEILGEQTPATGRVFAIVQ